MGRRVFISYEGHDRNKAKGFNLLRWNKNVEADFVGRHLLDPVKSTDRDYIREQIKGQISGSSVTVVICGNHTNESQWVADEIKWSLEKDPPNGILAIKLTPDAQVPPGVLNCGGEVMNWYAKKFDDAIQRAAMQPRRVDAIVNAGSGSAQGCVRS